MPPDKMPFRTMKDPRVEIKTPIVDAAFNQYGKNHDTHQLRMKMEQLEQQLNEAQKRIEQLDQCRLALESLTPQGSEFVNDPERCVEYVRSARTLQHQQILKQQHSLNEALAEKLNLNVLSKQVHEANIKWWKDPATGNPIKRNKGELLALIHSEISEALEGERKDLMDDKIPHRKMAEVELADAIIRILDYAAGFGYDLQGAFDEKMIFNANRQDHKHEARKIAGGKQF
jgi:hypothetical protein